MYLPASEKFAFFRIYLVFCLWLGSLQMWKLENMLIHRQQSDKLGGSLPGRGSCHLFQLTFFHQSCLPALLPRWLMLYMVTPNDFLTALFYFSMFFLPLSFCFCEWPLLLSSISYTQIFYFFYFSSLSSAVASMVAAMVNLTHISHFQTNPGLQARPCLPRQATPV